MENRNVGQALPDKALKGFTLIELLVVVLIIAILAAIAVPQYQKVVEKSRVIQAITLLKSVYEAAKIYYIAHGDWPENFNDLDIGIPWSGNTKWNTYQVKDTRSNKDWSIQLSKNNVVFGVEIGRISGPYAGTGFGIYGQHLNVPTKQLVCLEKNSHGNFLWEDKGSYCEDIFKGDLVYGAQGSYTYIYKLP